MSGSGIQLVEIVFLLLLLFVVAFGLLARKVKMPYPIALVIGGLLLSFIPGIPRINLNPDIIFFIVLPPLLFNAACLPSCPGFSYIWASSFLLPFGLVPFTVVAATQPGKWFLLGFAGRLGWVPA